MKSTLENAISIPVFASRARDLPPKTPRAVLVYVADEKLDREQSGMPYLPVMRKSQLEILLIAEGADEEISREADDICRDIELAMSAHHPEAAPVSSQVRYDGESRTVKTIIITTYAVENLDEMEK